MINDHEKPMATSLNLGTQKQLKKEDKNELKQLLIDLTDDKTTYRFSDQHFDREKEKRQLLSGAEFTLKEIKDNVRSMARPYKSIFPLSYFKEIYRLCGWPEAEATVYFRKREVAVFTNEAIYGTFNKGVLLSMHVLNPYTNYIKRTYKHHQFLTDDGLDKVKDIIEKAVRTMAKCNTMYEFRQEWFKEAGVPYQIDAFKF